LDPQNIMLRGLQAEVAKRTTYVGTSTDILTKLDISYNRISKRTVEPIGRKGAKTIN
jgi:hypothetical protein